MSDIRDKLMEKKAMDEMDFNAVINETNIIGFDPIVRVEGRYNNGGMVIGGPKYHIKGTKKSKISPTKALDLIEFDDKYEWIDDNWTSLNDEKQIFISFSPDVNVYIDLIVYIKYNIEYYNNQNIVILEEINMNEQNTSDLLRSGVKSNIKIHKQTDETVSVSTLKGNKSEYEIYEPIESHKMDEYNNIVLNYLSDKNSWVDGYFGEFEEKDGFLVVPLNISGDTYNLEFTQPFNDENKIWKIAELFNYNDPWNLENERFEYSIHSSKRNYFRKGFIRIKDPNSKKSSGIYNTIKERFSRYY